MDLKLGADVVCSDGRQAGKLRFVVLARKTYALDGIIVERGFLGARDTLLDKNDIAQIGPDGSRVDLKIDENELDQRPEYVAANSVTSPIANGESFRADEPFEGLPGGMGAASSPLADGIVANGTGVLPGPFYPVGTDYAETGASVVQTQYEDRITTDEGAPMIKEGARVADRYDNTVGNVSSLTLNEDGEVTALTVKEGFLFSTATIIPMEWVDSIADTSLSLKYAKEELGNTNDINGNIGERV